MSKILYGLSGDGRGHSTRSKVTIEHLIDKGHEVKIVTSGKGYEYLSEYFEVEEILGLRIVVREEQVDIWRTIWESSGNILNKGLGTLKTLSNRVKYFDPDVLISDFEPFISFISILKRVPLISIDHQHIITHCELEYPEEWNKDFLLAGNICKGITGFAKHYYISSFFPSGQNRINRGATFVGPILRNEVFKQSCAEEDYILIYIRTPDRKEAILPLIEDMDSEFIAYGFDDLNLELHNITFKRPSTEGFLEDLAHSKAIITNGGYSLISEALYFGKPIYSIPTRRDFEQMINGYYVEKLGYGLYDLYPSIIRIEKFLKDIEYFKENIARNKDNFNGNDYFLEMLDSKIKEIS